MISADQMIAGLIMQSAATSFQVCHWAMICSLCMGQLYTSNCQGHAFPPEAELSPKITSAQTLPAPGPSLSNPSCELGVLERLGQQQAYNADGYALQIDWLPQYADAWQDFGCLMSWRNLSLTGSVPQLPDAWAANGSLPSLQIVNLTKSGYAGTLPSSWAASGSIPNLTYLDLTYTQLSGTLPPEWGNPGAFCNLNTLLLNNTNLSGTCLLLQVGHSFQNNIHVNIAYNCFVLQEPACTLYLTKVLVCIAIRRGNC